MSAPFGVQKAVTVIAPSETLTVVCNPHPLRLTPQYLSAQPGDSIAEIVRRCEVDFGAPNLFDCAEVKVDGISWPREWWARTRIHAGRHVSVRAVPGDFVFTPIATAIASAAFGGSALAAGLIKVGLAIGASLLANLVRTSLFPPSETTSERPKEVYSIGGSRNEIVKWDPIPDIWGGVRAAGIHLTAPFTEFEGDDQYVTMLLCWGYGPLGISDIKIGETPIDDYDDVEVQTFEGYINSSSYSVVKLRGKPDHYNQTLVANATAQRDLNVTIKKADGWVSRTTSEDCLRIQVDLVCPNGLYEQKGGKLTDHPLRFESRYRLVGSSGAWSTLKNVMLRGDSADPIRRSYSEKVPVGQYEVQIRKTNEDKNDDGDFADTLVWTALRSVIDSPPIDFNIPLAITAIRIRASDQLSGQPDDVNAICYRRGDHWTGSSWIENSKIANPADIARYVLQGNANGRRVPDSEIDFDSLERWHDRCDAKGWRIEMRRNFLTSVRQALIDVCAAGRCVPVPRDGKWSFAFEESDAPIVQHFTPLNSWGFAMDLNYPEVPHAFRVKFLNARKGYVEDERLVYNDRPGGGRYTKSTATLIEKIELPGITNSDLIEKHARYRFAEARLRKDSYTFFADMEGFIPTRGDRIRLSHDVLMNEIASATVEARSGNVLTLSQAVMMEPGKSYAVAVRGKDGTFYSRSVVTSGGVTNIITLSGTGPLPTARDGEYSGDLLSFRPATTIKDTFRVKALKPGPNLSVQLTVVDDAPEIEDADDGPIPDFESGVLAPVDLTKVPPKNLKFRTVKENVNGRMVIASYLTWEVATLGDVLYFLIEMWDGNGNKKKFRTDGGELRRYRWENLKKGSRRITVRAMYANRRRNLSSGAIKVA